MHTIHEMTHVNESNSQDLTFLLLKFQLHSFYYKHLPTYILIKP